MRKGENGVSTKLLSIRSLEHRTFDKCPRYYTYDMNTAVHAYWLIFVHIYFACNVIYYFSFSQGKLISSPELEVLKVSYCNHSQSVSICCPSIHFFFSLHSSIYKYEPISTKLGQNLYDHKISIHFHHGSNPTWLTGVICPWIRKIAIFDLLYILASTNIN